MSKAVELFTAVPKLHNCAQAVAGGCNREDLIEAFASMGGGKAPGGMCGALYAALEIVPENKREIVREKFIDFAGSDSCVTLKTCCGTACVDCVSKAADLVEFFSEEK